MIQVFFCTSNIYFAVLSVVRKSEMVGVIVIDNTVNGFVLYGQNGVIKNSWSFPFETNDFLMKKNFILTTLDSAMG